MSRLKELFEEIKDEREMTNEIIKTMIEKETCIFQWNMGRVIVDNKIAEEELPELLELMKEEGYEDYTVEDLKEFAKNYQECPTLTEFI